MTRRSRFIAVFGLLGVMSAACIGRAEVSVPDATNLDAKKGGHLVVGITEPASIDPGSANRFEPSGALVIGAICDPLIRFDPLTGEPVPAIAESWQVRDGGSSLFVSIRKGVKFHNGQELLADDIINAISRVARREYGSPVAGLLSAVRGYGRVHGDEDFDAEVEIDPRDLEIMSGLRPLERYAFEVSLIGDFSEFFRVLGHLLSSPIPLAVAQDRPGDFTRQPVCTGPYKLVEPWEPGNPVIKVERFADYYADNTGHPLGGAGYPDTIDFRIFPNRDAAANAYFAGEIDVVAIPRARLDEARGSGDQLETATTQSLEYIGVPTTEPPFDSRFARLALSQALNREQINANVFGGALAPARGFLPPALGEYHRDSGCPAAGPPTGDPSLAKETLAEARLTLEGQTFPFYFNDEFGYRELAAEVASQWSAAFGANFELRGMIWDEYLAAASDQQGFDGPFRMSFSSQYPSADSYLRSLFHSASIGGTNFARFNDSTFDRDMDFSAREATTEEDRLVEYGSLDDLACAEMPVIPIAFGTRHYLIRKDKIGAARDAFVDISSGEVLLRELFVRQ